MKKIILIIVILLLCSCYDYKEVNDLAFVNTIGIDYDTKYHLYFEILTDSSNQDKNDTANNSYIINAEGISIEEAFNNISLKINKIPYFSHLKAVIIDKKNATNNMKEITDYILRNTEIRNEFYMIVTTKNESKDIISINKENDNNIGDSIYNLIENNNRSYNISYNYYFSDMIDRLNNPNLEMLTTECNLKNNDIYIEGIALFKNYKYVKTLDKEDSNILNTLLGNGNNMSLSKDNISIKIYENNINYKIKKNKIEVNVKSNAEITDNTGNIDLYNKDSYLYLNKEFSSIYYNKLYTCLMKNLYYLNIRDCYYKKYKKELDFSKVKIKLNANININKKGMIFDINE